MKNILKTILKMALICLLALLSGCEAEKDLTKNNKLVMRKFSMNDIANKGNSKLAEAVGKIKSMHPAATNESARIVFDEKSGLYFDDEKGIYIEMDDIKSYTFPVIRTSISEKVMNICFNEKSTGNYDVYIVKYDFTKEEAENLTKEQLMQREKAYIQLIKDGNPVTTYSIVCVDILQQVEISEFEGILDGDATETHVQWVTIDSFCYDAGAEDYDGFNYGSGSGSDNPGDTNTGGTEDSNGIITGTLISDTEAPIPGSIPLGIALEYFEDSLDDLALPVYNAHPELREYLAMNNCDFNSREFVMGMIAVFQGEEYTQEQKEAISHLIAYCANNGSTFSIDSSVNANNSIPLNDENELNDFLNNQNDEGGEFTYEMPQPNLKISSTKLWIGVFNGVKFNVKQNITPYSVINVTSELFGATIFVNWHQTDYTTSISENIVTIDVYGVYSIKIFFEDVGTIYHENQHIQIKIDKLTGNIISSKLIH
jgi:hypothetical protein